MVARLGWRWIIMANWSDPRGQATAYGTTGTVDSATDAGLRSYMLRVYNTMASGVLLSGIVAMGFSTTDFAKAMAAGQGGALSWIIILAPLAFVMVLSFGINRLSTVAAQGLFWACQGPDLIGPAQLRAQDPGRTSPSPDPHWSDQSCPDQPTGERVNAGENLAVHLSFT